MASKLEFDKLALWLGITFVALTNSCVGSRNREYPSTYLREPKSAFSDDRYYVAALDFNQWLRTKNQPSADGKLLRQCQSNSESSPFCYSVLNYQELENRYRSENSTKKKTSSRTLIAKFKQGQVTNWLDLRFSPVTSSLRGLSRLRPDEVDTLATKALAEDACPNHISTALAAYLEDQLPKTISYITLAKLYEKGGKCPPEAPGESETLITRAGLFYFAANQLDRAESCFKQSAQDKEAFRSRALYWLSRVYEEKKQTKLSKETLKELKTNYPFSFHTLMALHANKEDPGVLVSSKSPTLMSRSEKLPHLNNLIFQAELLIKFGFNESADKVFNWIVSDSERAEPEFMLYLADLRQSQGNHLSQLKILTSVLYANPKLTSKSVLERYFPKLYYPIFEKHAQGLDPYLLMSIARRESAFNPRAVSRARAKGLMQISPHTQRRLSSTKNIFDPEANISVGSRYLSDLIKKTNGQIHLALAGYNAGPNRVDIWTNRYAVTDPILFIDLIPFRETREYVASVLRNYYWYRRLHTESPAKPGFGITN